MAKAYDGPVCYQDGWHKTVDKDGNPGQNLYLEDEGSYRLAKDGDLSWHERYHGQTVEVRFE